MTGIGYNGITINLRNKTGKTNPPGDLGTPLANDPRVREALDLSIDREALNQVAWDGQYTPGCTPISPNSPFYDKSRKCPARDVAKAKKLLADAGLAGGYSFEMTIVNDPQQRRVGEVIQGMARRPASTSACAPPSSPPPSSDNDDGKHAAFLIGWSGRVDPDANIHQFHTCGGQPQHDAGLRRDDRRAPEQGARGHRPGAARRRSTARPSTSSRASGATSSTSTT